MKNETQPQPLISYSRYCYGDFLEWLQFFPINIRFAYLRKMLLVGVRETSTSVARDVATSLLAYNSIADAKQVEAIFSSIGPPYESPLIKKISDADYAISELSASLNYSDWTLIETICRNHPLYLWAGAYLGYREPPSFDDDFERDVSERYYYCDFFAVMEYHYRKTKKTV